MPWSFPSLETDLIVFFFFFVNLVKIIINAEGGSRGQGYTRVDSIPNLESFGLVIGLDWVRRWTIAADLRTLPLDGGRNFLSQKARARPNHRCCKVQWTGEGIVLMIPRIQVREELAGTREEVVVHVPRRKRRSGGIDVHVALIVVVGWRGPRERVWRSCRSGR